MKEKKRLIKKSQRYLHMLYTERKPVTTATLPGTAHTAALQDAVLYYFFYFKVKAFKSMYLKEYRKE